MPKKNADQIKIYIVIGLALFLAIVGYFRLIHKKEQPKTTNPNFSDSTASENKMQHVEPVTLQQRDWHARLAAEPMRAITRDIFFPVNPLKRLKPQTSTERSISPPPSLELKGTIVGGDRPIAIIDDKFVRTNDRIEGYRVIWIGKKMVVMDSGEKKLILELMQND